MEQTEQDRSEEPTSFKLDRARREGTVARGADLGFLTGLSAFFVYVLICGADFGQAAEQALRRALIGGPALADGSDNVLPAATMLFSSIFQPLAIMAGAIFVVVLLFELVQTGVVFSSKPLKPDFSRLNPATGFKRLFTMRLLIETGKNVLKLGIYTAVGYFVVHDALQSDAGAITDGHSLAAVVGNVAVRLIAAFLAVALLFAVLDQLIVRREFHKKMRMSRREVRREARDREGEPRLKQKRKQMHAEFAKMAQSVRNIRKADVLVTNPEHLAIGLRYEPRYMHAPLIVSVGENHLAQRLKRLAFVYNIPVFENRALARELYRKAGLNRPVPENCFRPVADIYNTLRRRSSAREAELPKAGPQGG
jgi:flagellar biosynthesis protein FlhB